MNNYELKPESCISSEKIPILLQSAGFQVYTFYKVATESEASWKSWIQELIVHKD